mgnify:CR=1 FL=1
MDRVTEVAAALIWQEDRFLICQRPAHKARGLLWEFVGGKQEPGETLAQTLIRECREELDVTVSVGPVFFRVLHVYPDITIRLTLFNAALESGEIRLLEHNAAAWITPEEIDAYDFCPADEEILSLLRQLSPTVRHIRRRLFDAAEADYRSFHSRLMPNVDPDRILGVRMPRLRALARELAAEKEAFCSRTPHWYYEENNLHALFLMQERDFDAALSGVEAFLPLVDNWATCDLLKPAVFGKHRQALLPHIRRWLESGHPYTVRFAVKMLMDFYLDEAFSPEHLQLVAAVQSAEYYVNMARAWYFATALAKQWDEAAPYLREGRLDPQTHRMTVRKGMESFRITKEQKALLQTWKG